jgi:hypothetical protein
MITTLTFFASPTERTKINLPSLTGPSTEHPPVQIPLSSARYRQTPVSSDQVVGSSEPGQLSRVETVVKALITEYLRVDHFRFF